MPNDNIIIKNYEHVNRSLPNWDTPNGKYIGSRKQYENELKKSGLEPYNGRGQPTHKKWVPSQDLHRALGEVKAAADRRGNINLSTHGRLVDKMKKMGVSFNPSFMTDDLKGGIDAPR